MKRLAVVLTLVTFFILNQSCVTTSNVGIKHKEVFPTVTGTDLHGDERTFPDYFTKPRTIVVVAFQRWQQSLCDEWYKNIKKYVEENEHSAFFEIPTISKMNAFTRWFIYNGMRGGIKDDNMRSQVVTLHIDKTPFKNALKIDTEETVFTYVLDENGVILESIKGEWTEEKWALATAALDKGKK